MVVIDIQRRVLLPFDLVRSMKSKGLGCKRGLPDRSKDLETYSFKLSAKVFASFGEDVDGYADDYVDGFSAQGFAGSCPEEFERCLKFLRCWYGSIG